MRRTICMFAGDVRFDYVKGKGQGSKVFRARQLPALAKNFAIIRLNIGCLEAPKGLRAFASRPCTTRACPRNRSSTS